MPLEKTFVMFKPDCMKKGVLGHIVHRLAEAGLKLKALKMVWLDDAALITTGALFINSLKTGKNGLSLWCAV